MSLAVAMLLRLLVTWAHDCQPALQALLAPPGHLPMLLELAQKRYLTSPHATASSQESTGTSLVLYLCAQQPVLHAQSTIGWLSAHETPKM